MRADARGNVGGDRLQERVDAFGELLGLSRMRVDAAPLAEAGALLDRVAERRRLSRDHTVVALAGATGSGKSSLFNALTGIEISETGVRRPTTASPVACAWDRGGATALLDRLGIPPQARFGRRALLDGVHTRFGGPDAGLEGLVLLDLPDHDSAVPEHRQQVDRLLELVDVVVWVLDPEKYGDAVLHQRYLRPLAGHADVTIIVMNQIDRLRGEAAEQVLDDLRRLLDEDGLAVGEYGEAGAVVVAASAATGEGMEEVRSAIAQVVAERGAADRRLSADVDLAAARLRPAFVGRGRAGLTDEAREEFSDRLAEAVGATAAGQTAERDWVDAARRACGVPWVRLLVRGYRTSRAAGRAREEQWRIAPAPAPAAVRPAVAEAVRCVADAAADGLPAPWAQAVREAARRGERGLPEALDEAAERAEEGETQWPRWWAAARGVQWVLVALVVLAVAGVVGGLGLLLTGAGAGPGVRAGVAVGVLWMPAALLAVGLCGGPVLAWVCSAGSRGAARRYGQDVERRLRDAAAECGRARVLEPVAAELLRYREVREQYGVASGG
ncbi:50S ribosome-binding GTPase [Streptomyces sp. RB6PN25]|uniref:50S ribosome-binding GTPase n=1 Tax=Streptomyces humicola TaxID=2953240 RepID=A0ABT1PW06_9ACTN|nr:GTPase [Streptomyces humicola]MCQ4081853.1 50S ribosome-binding GTPase [Streptomyces humicola]